MRPVHGVSIPAGTLLIAVAAILVSTTLVAEAPAEELVTPVVTKSSIITRTAGTGAAGFSGDGVAATSTRLSDPRDTAFGPDGSLYIADTYNHRIRKVDTQGIITTVAGNGVGGYGGDNGLATGASINLPHDVTVDAAGVIYIADSSNHRIRRVAPNGIITTIAGTGASGFNGDNRLATTARLKNPKSVALFGGDLYIADGNNHRIRKVSLTTGIITTVAGTGVAGFSGDGGSAVSARMNTPQRIALDSVGNLYFTDTLNNRIRRVDALSGVISTVAGNGTTQFSGDGGQGTSASIRRPRGVALADNQTLYIADSEHHRVRLLDLTTGIISTVAGTGSTAYVGDNGPAGQAGFKNPRGLSVDSSGNLVIADTFHSVIRTVATTTVSP